MIKEGVTDIQMQKREKLISDEVPPRNIPERSVKRNDIINREGKIICHHRSVRKRLFYKIIFPVRKANISQRFKRKKIEN